MVRKGTRVRRTIVEEDGEGNGEDDLTPTAIAEQAADERLKLREPTAGIKRVLVTGQLEHLDTVPLNLVNEDWLAETYGGGKYVVYKKGYNGEGKWGFIGQETLEVDSSLPFKGSLRAQAERRGEDRNAPTIPGPSGGGAAALLEAGVFNLMKQQADLSAQASEAARTQNAMMMNMMQQSNAFVMKMMESSSRPAMDLPALISAIGSLAPILLPLFQRKDALTAADIKELIRETKPTTEPQKLTELLEVVKTMREAMGDGGEGGGGFSGVLEKALNVLPMLIERTATASTRTPASMPTTPANVAPSVTATVLPVASSAAVSPVSEGSGVGNGVAEGDEAAWQFVAPYIGQLRMAAAINRDPRRVAATVWEFADPTQRATLTEVLDDETFVDRMFARFTELQSHRSWTLRFLDALADEAFGTDLDDEDVLDDEVAGAPSVPSVSGGVIPIPPMQSASPDRTSSETAPKEGVRGNRKDHKEPKGSVSATDRSKDS